MSRYSELADVLIQGPPLPEPCIVTRVRAAAAPSPEWVKTSERLPTREDADEDGYLWSGELGRTMLEHYHDAPLYPYWMPKPRAQPPEPPEGE